MKDYDQLTIEQRYQIDILLKAGKAQKEIAVLLNVSPSTISRELRRNGGKRGYRPKQAQNKADNRRRSAGKAIKMTPEIIEMIEAKIRIEWSPEQISGWLGVEHGIGISHERIYQHIEADQKQGGDLVKYLRFNGKKRKRRNLNKDKRGQIKNRVCIDQRPVIVDEKTRIGDWEIDLVIGKDHQGALLTVVDRCSKYTLIKKLDGKGAEGVNQALISLLAPYDSVSHTITSDNGKEFALHEQVAQALGIDFYFAHPYHSWERGLNENTNGLIRQYFPKSTNLKDITDEQVVQVMDRLNNRPRKMLCYQTPHHVFFEQIIARVA